MKARELEELRSNWASFHLTRSLVNVAEEEVHRHDSNERKQVDDAHARTCRAKRFVASRLQ